MPAGALPHRFACRAFVTRHIGINRSTVSSPGMCDLSEEEFAEYLRWLEAATAPSAPAKVRPRRIPTESETVVSPVAAASPA